MSTVRTSLRLLQVEMIITATVASMPIMVPFYHSIGMDQGQIGLSQAMFTIALLMVNIPTGWIADRFSRKMCNIIGDLGCAVFILLYSQATSFAHVVFAEVMLGIFMSFSQGADSGLLKAYAKILDSSGGLFHKLYAMLSIWQPIAQVVALSIGGLVGASNPRLAIAISAIPFAVGCILSLFMKEKGERLVSQHRNPLRDMLRVTRESVSSDPKLRWLIVGYAVSNKITHVMIWALTPLMLLAGVPPTIITVGWILNSVCAASGARIAGWWARRFNTWQKFVIPTTAVLVALIIMSAGLSIWTVWLYSLLGLAQGWSSAVMMPMVQQEVPDSNQATAVSIARSFGQILYVPLVWIIAIAGNKDIRLSLVATIVIFLPMVIITGRKLYIVEHPLKA